MDIKTEIKIEEEDLELPSEYPHQGTHIPPDNIIYLKPPPAQGEVDEDIRPETASRDIESSDFNEDYGNSEKDTVTGKKMEYLGKEKRELLILQQKAVEDQIRFQMEEHELRMKSLRQEHITKMKLLNLQIKMEEQRLFKKKNFNYL
ncbi:hypothetical protein Anas_12472 [Armadillidium nasatum]|uniref:Myb/SANT-like DNA-binding domain-containing protein 4 n=1 Tax=Armadillidium nasatum TaxID=96803 RepID=A0A5N5TIP0_9CRUS|nr:hypothetical protein Anas_10883 [Armadillidium nasatum]KAB7504920.1 hypothetical protein Anas_12472 [Armadillidium nasatum]